MTGAEIELAAADAVPDLSRRMSEPPPEGRAACANCGSVLSGRYCHDCGQGADLHKRSVLHLAWEAVEALFHMDGRLARTLPLLFLRPGVLARDLIAGRIARYTPPFRTFLVSLFLFIIAAEGALHEQPPGPEASAPSAASAQPTPAEMAEIKSDVEGIFANFKSMGMDPERARQLNEGAQEALERPGYFMTVFFGWAHRLAFLLLPIMTALLSALYFYRKSIFIYDHFLVSCNLLSFGFLTNAVTLVLPSSIASAWFFLLMLWTPVNMFQTLSGAYGSSRIGAALKTLVLWPGSVLTFGLLMLGLLTMTLSQL